MSFFTVAPEVEYLQMVDDILILKHITSSYLISAELENQLQHLALKKMILGRLVGDMEKLRYIVVAVTSITSYFNRLPI